MPLDPMEAEAISLHAAIESLDELVSHALFDLLGSDPDTEVRFKEAVHQRLFNILLVDLLSAVNRATLGKGGSLISVLQAIAEDPVIGSKEDAAGIKASADGLSCWLSEEIDVPVWLPSLDTEGSLRITRFEFIYICGNIGKHGFARLDRVADKLSKVLERNGVQASPEEALMVLDDFYERFHTDILNYHATTLAELLNDIRWSIHDYLRPAYRAALRERLGEVPPYSFALPSGLSRFSRTCFWALMNSVREGPPVRKFVGTKWLKLRY